MPDLTSVSGVLELLSLCNLVILGNVLDHRTYSAPNQDAEDEATETQEQRIQNYDLNDIERTERDEMILARGVSIHLLKWVVATLRITNTETGNHVSIDSIIRLYLGKQAAAILKYKQLAWNPVDPEERVYGAPHCTPHNLEVQLENALDTYPGALAAYEECKGNFDDSLDYGPKALLYSVETRGEPQLLDGREIFSLIIESYEIDVSLTEATDEDFCRWGTTALDKKYKNFLRRVAVHNSPLDDPIADMPRGKKRRL